MTIRWLPDADIMRSRLGGQDGDDDGAGHEHDADERAEGER